MTKSLIFTAPKVVEMIEEPMPVAKNGCVVVRLMRSSISPGTERANLVGEYNVTLAKDTVPFPRRAGYSSSGFVTAVGEGVKDFSVGDRVGLSWSVHSQYFCAPVENVHKLPDEISFEDAALVHIATFPMAAIRLIRLGRLDLGSLVEEIHSPDDAKEIYARLAACGGFPIVQFDWSLI